MAIQAARFYRNPTNTAARSLFRASLLYISVFMVRQFRAFKSCCGHNNLLTSLRSFRISCQPVHMHPLCYVQFIVAIAIRSHNGPPGPTAHTLYTLLCAGGIDCTQISRETPYRCREQPAARCFPGAKSSHRQTANQYSSECRRHRFPACIRHTQPP